MKSVEARIREILEHYEDLPELVIADLEDLVERAEERGEVRGEENVRYS